MGSTRIVSANRFDKLALFSFAWAVANVLHALSFADRINLQHPFAIAVILAAALAILLPWSVWPFLLMLGCSLANTLEWMPYAPNHITFEFVVNGGILATLVWSIVRLYAREKTTAALATPAYRETLFRTFAPFVRISLFVLYFYAVLHKLNRDYFNVDISCSTFLLSGYSKRIPFIPNNIVVQWSAVWGTILIEAAIPLLLYFRKTRLAGVLLCCGFHYFLALHPHPGLYSFSALLFAIYCLFLPNGFIDAVQVSANKMFNGTQQRVFYLFRNSFFFLVTTLITLSLTASSYIGNLAHKLVLTGFLVWLVWGLVLIVFLVYTLVYTRTLYNEYDNLFHMPYIALWVIPCLLLFNGMTPYLGIKTQTNFSMFSNLRTEGNISNHLFIPGSLQIDDMEKDLVEVTNTDLPALQTLVDNKQVIPYFEFQRITSTAHIDFFATYIRDSEEHTIKVAKGISNQPELLVPHGWLAAKFIRFRPVDKGPCLCKH